MATLYVTEFQYVGWQRDAVQLALAPPTVASNNVVIGAGSLQSNPFNAHTNLIRVHCDTVCSILIGANPTATAQQDARMAANQTEYFFVAPGHRIAVIATTP